MGQNAEESRRQEAEEAGGSELTHAWCYHSDAFFICSISQQSAKIAGFIRNQKQKKYGKQRTWLRLHTNQPQLQGRLGKNRQSSRPVDVRSKELIKEIKVLEIHEALQKANESINKLGLVPVSLEIDRF